MINVLFWGYIVVSMMIFIGCLAEYFSRRKNYIRFRSSNNPTHVANVTMHYRDAVISLLTVPLGWPLIILAGIFGYAMDEIKMAAEVISVKKKDTK